jgi:hypothetical protein
VNAKGVREARYYLSYAYAAARDAFSSQQAYGVMANNVARRHAAIGGDVLASKYAAAMIPAFQTAAKFDAGTPDLGNSSSFR